MLDVYRINGFSGYLDAKVTNKSIIKIDAMEIWGERHMLKTEREGKFLLWRDSRRDFARQNDIEF